MDIILKSSFIWAGLCSHRNPQSYLRKIISSSPHNCKACVLLCISKSFPYGLSTIYFSTKMTSSSRNTKRSKNASYKLLQVVHNLECVKNEKSPHRKKEQYLGRPSTGKPKSRSLWTGVGMKVLKQCHCWGKKDLLAWRGSHITAYQKETWLSDTLDGWRQERGGCSIWGFLWCILFLRKWDPYYNALKDRGRVTNQLSGKMQLKNVFGHILLMYKILFKNTEIASNIKNGEIS